MGLSKPASSSRQHTGDPLLDRVQLKIGELVARVRFILTTLSQVGLGSLTIEMRDEDYRLTPEEISNVHLSFQGELTAPRRVIVPPASARNRSFVRWFSNVTTGGFSLTFVASTAGGSSVVIASPDTRAVIIKEADLATLN